MTRPTEITTTRKNRIKIFSAMAMQGMLAGDRHGVPPSDKDSELILEKAVDLGIRLDEKVDAALKVEPGMAPL